MQSILFTGFPGFLGSQLLPPVLRRSPERRAACIVQPKFMKLAQSRVAELERADPSLAGRIDLLAGDITQPGLGLEEAAGVARSVVDAYHLGAVYDLAVARHVAMNVNANGTRNVLRFFEGSPNLERLHYVSTCYVSGRHHGVFTEGDLEVGQKFNNYYEESKFLAEIDVQRAMKGGFPATVYRPSIVVGDSRSGETQKFDGPYYVIRWVLRQSKLSILPVVGRPRQHYFNVVPREYVIGAIAYLSGRSESEGKVYQLADPEPLTVHDVISAIGEATGHRIVRLPLPIKVAKGSIDYVPGVYAVMKIPSAAVDYFVHPTRYTNVDAVRDLEGSGVTLPAFADYLPNLVKFVRQHPEIGSEAMV